MENAKHNRKRAGAIKRALLWLILAGCLVGFYFVLRYLYTVYVDPMSAFETPAPVPAATAAPGADAAEPERTPEPTLSPEERLLLEADMSFMENRVNILMLGWDESPERLDEDGDVYRDEENNFRSDVIMLLSVDFDSKRAELISVPRDTYAPIYNTNGRWKINAAFAKGGSAKGEGFTYAMKTVSALLGVPIDYYAGVNMVGMKAVVDAMGGVDYDVDVRIELNGRVLETGFQHLNGQQVLDYCRARKGISTDVGRADRQQRMLFAIFAQLKAREQIANIPDIYLSVRDYIETNLDFSQISALAAFALGLDMDKLGRNTLAGEYISNTPYSGASFYVLYNDELEALVKRVFGISIKTDPRYDAAYVLGDKSAAAALGYANGADALLNLLYSRGYSAGSDQPLILGAEESLAQVKRVCARTDEAEPLDSELIERAKESLRESMYYLVTGYSLTAAELPESSFPKEFWKLIPASGAAAGE